MFFKIEFKHIKKTKGKKEKGRLLMGAADRTKEIPTSTIPRLLLTEYT